MQPVVPLPIAVWRWSVIALIGTLALTLGGALWLGAGGAAVPHYPRLTVEGGVDDLPVTGSALTVEAEGGFGAADAWGVQVGAVAFLIHRDGYVTTSTDAPRWQPFPHIVGGVNRLRIHVTDQQASLWINDERVTVITVAAPVTIGWPPAASPSTAVLVRVWSP